MGSPALVVHHLAGDVRTYDASGAQLASLPTGLSLTQIEQLFPGASVVVMKPEIGQVEHCRAWEAARVAAREADFRRRARR